MAVRLNSKVKFESLTKPGRWFHGRVYGIAHHYTKTYALVHMSNGGPLNRQHVELSRLVEEK